MKVIIAYTVPATFCFALATIKELKKRGHDIILISSMYDELKNLSQELGVRYYCVPFERSINLSKDFETIGILKKILKKENPNIVIGATPKAGLIAMISSKLVGVKTRLYHIFGFPYETSRGLRRILLKNVERISCFFASHVLPISPSIGETCKKDTITYSSKLINRGFLTIGGVDTTRFDKKNINIDLKDVLNIGKSKVIGFVGRITEDKGIRDYINVTTNLQKNGYDIKCIVIGSLDKRLPFDEDVLTEFCSREYVLHIPYTNEIEKYINIFDVLLLPSYREGFGNSNVESESMEVPVVCYDVTGCKDAVKDGFTGILVPFRNENILYEKTKLLLDNDELRCRLGKNGRKYVIDNFKDDFVAINNVKIFEELLAHKI